jgi:TonB family protein
LGISQMRVGAKVVKPAHMQLTYLARSKQKPVIRLRRHTVHVSAPFTQHEQAERLNINDSRIRITPDQRADAISSAPRGFSGFGGGSGGINGSGTGVGDLRLPPRQVRFVEPPRIVTTVPVILSEPKASYTAEAREAGIQGEVVLHVKFTKQGTVEVVDFVNKLGKGLDEQAAIVISGIVFKPATVNGVAVDYTTTVHVTFTLTNGD